MSQREWDYSELCPSPLKGAARSPCELRVLRRLRRLVEPMGSHQSTTPLINKKAPIRGLFIYMAERVGFEPTIRFDPYT